MSDNQLKAEFLASFQTYVDDDRDIRLETLKRMLKEPVDEIVELVEPHDMAALMTSATYVDPRDPQAQLLRDEYEHWMRERATAENNGDDPNMIEFNMDMNDTPLMFDKNVEGLSEFLKYAPVVEGGDTYLIKIFVCLMWAHKIPEIKANLWRPGR